MEVSPPPLLKFYLSAQLIWPLSPLLFGIYVFLGLFKENSLRHPVGTQ